jgi:hypothetical protein
VLDEHNWPQSSPGCWLANNLLIAIIGGALACLLGTYAVAEINHVTGASAPVALPTSPGPILIQVDPDRIVAAQGSATIAVYISGLTPDGTVDADLNEPDSGTYVGESAIADTQGDFTFTPRWSPTFKGGGATPTGDYRITIRDAATGATATAIVQVIP